MSDATKGHKIDAKKMRLRLKTELFRGYKLPSCRLCSSTMQRDLVENEITKIQGEMYEGVYLAICVMKKNKIKMVEENGKLLFLKNGVKKQKLLNSINMGDRRGFNESLKKIKSNISYIESKIKKIINR